MATTTWTTLHNNTAATSARGVAYAARVEVDGNQVRVYRQPAGGGVETLVASATTNVTGAGSVRVTGLNGGNYTLDDVRVLADDLSRSTTFTAANNNELATMADYNGTTSYAFDDWGRLSTETRGSVTKTYGWTKANLLASVNSSDPADTDVSYGYTGDLKRLFRFENSVLKNSYNYGAGFAVTDEATWSGGSTVAKKTYADGLAEVDVTGTPAYSYLTHDHLGSTRGMWDGSKAATGAWEFTPYGAPYSFAGPSGVTQLYTGHDLDRVTGNYSAPFRTLNPGTGRWLRRDPLGMVDGTNLYRYVGSNPLSNVDPLGLLGFKSPGFDSADDAADAAINSILSKSRFLDREYGGEIYKKRNKFYYTEPRKGSIERVTVGLFPRGSIPAGVYHTHGALTPGYLDEVFSDGDRQAAADLGVPVYLGTPSGDILKFDPSKIPCPNEGVI